jgi:5'(3')-deoxyribonucleotidase
VIERQPFVLGVDLDGVCADFIRGLRPIAEEWLGEPPGSLPLAVQYGFPEWKLQRRGTYDDLHRFAVMDRAIFRALPPVPGASEALWRLSDRGVRIRIITHRLYIEGTHEEAVTQTVGWLERHRIPYWDICFIGEKGAVGANLYVDDTDAIIAALRSEGHDAIVFTGPGNLISEAPRANNWQDLERIVLKYVERYESAQSARPDLIAGT